MKKIEELEKVGRQAWLATIGTYAKGWEILSGKVNETFEDTNQLINELVENGEKIETDLKAKIKRNTLLDYKILALKVKLGVEESFDDKLDLLNKKVDQLTNVIEKLVEAKTAEAKAEKFKAAKEVKVAAVAKESPALTEKVVAVKKAVVKRAAVKKVTAKTETTPAARPTRARRSTAKTKAAEVK